MRKGRSNSWLRRSSWNPNLILVGGTGIGKTHLATALGVAAIHHGKRIRFYNAVDLVNRLEQEKRSGKSGVLARQLT